MRIIKPGKVASLTPGEKRKTESTVKPPREVWDDFAVTKKSKRKREYEKGDGNRMVPKPARVVAEDQLSFAAPAEEDLEPVQYREDFEVLENVLQFAFKDRTLLLRALTHRSALAIRERTDYERLEFLGDAVLDLSIAHLLCEQYPEAKEGELSKMRAALVNTQALATVAKGLDIGSFIRLGRGEVSSGGQERPSILADVMEAIIGAIYQDAGYEQAFQVVQLVFGGALDQVQPSDPKTELQEALHAAGSEPPSYLLELVEGPEHAPTFVTVVHVDGEIAGRGRGATKKAAQQAAAAEALAKMSPPQVALRLKEGQSIFIPELLLALVEIPGAEVPDTGIPDAEMSSAEKSTAESSDTEISGAVVNLPATPAAADDGQADSQEEHADAPSAEH